MVNKISTRTFLNPFGNKHFYIIEIDDVSLEDLILEKQPQVIKGVVPTLLNWLRDKEERQEVWSRVLPEKNEKSNLPILMCSDDVDLWCTLIMVEVETDDNYVYWNRFGLENSNAKTPREIGKSIGWFPNISKMIFDKEKYKKVLEEFKIRLNDNSIYNPRDSEIVREYIL